MKTNRTNGARTPEVVAKELSKVGKLEALVSTDNLEYLYYTTPQFGEESPAVEVTRLEGKAVNVRTIPKEALPYLIPERSKISDIPSNANFKFGGF